MKIDCSGSLSFAIRGIPSPIRPPIRHSGEGRNPEAVGRGKATRRWKKLTRRSIFILLCGPRKAMVIPAIGSMPVPRYGAGIQRGRVAPTTPKHFQRPSLIFIPWCAGDRRHERLVRKHVPDSDPGCALQSTSMPALHRRNVPNCRPIAAGGMRKCSAVEGFARRGACPPQGSGRGRIRRANSLYQATTPAFHRELYP